MIYRILADIVFILHFCFVLFVIFGGLLVLCRRWILWLHLPALAWGILIEFLRLPCPLTAIEKGLIERGGDSVYAGDFIEHYVSLILYSTISPQTMWILGVLLIAFNLLIYAYIFRQQPIKFLH